MYYRTRTYIAADWDGDKNLVDKLYEWNDKDNLALSFSDAHQLIQARDSSLPCTIKKSLSTRLGASKTFLLIVGEHTMSVTKGSCQYCSNYSSYWGCNKNNYTHMRSFIEYECEKAVRDGMNIIVVYNSDKIQRSKCPSVLRYTGEHINGLCKGVGGSYYWNYQDIKNAIMRY